MDDCGTGADRTLYNTSVCACLCVCVFYLNVSSFCSGQALSTDSNLIPDCDE